LDSTADQFAFTWYNMGVIPPMVKKDMWFRYNGVKTKRP
jgi:hypothetical protein